MGDTEGEPQVAVNAAGSAVVAGRHILSANRPGRVVAVHYDAITHAWGERLVIGAIDLNAATSSPVVAMDPLGNALAVWDFHDSDPIAIVTARYTVADGWTADVELDSPTAGEDPQIVVNRQGKAWMVWGSRAVDNRRDINATPFH